MMKTGKNNRFLASILAASMMLTMSPFAFAADTAEQKEMTTGKSKARKKGDVEI